MTKKKKIKENTEDYENYEDYEGMANVPARQVDLNVLIAGDGFALLKDEVSRNIFSVERYSNGVVYLRLIQRGQKN